MFGLLKTDTVFVVVCLFITIIFSLKQLCNMSHLVMATQQLWVAELGKGKVSHLGE